MPNFWKTLPKPFTVLAPLDDVTDVVFREMVANTARPDVFFTEFTTADGLFSPGRDRIIHKLKFTKNQRPIVAQVWGINTENLYKTGKLISELGFDGIDINMGCPSSDIMNKGCGSAMIENYDLTHDVIQATREGAKGLPISVKTRLGKKTNVADKWIAFLLEQNLDALTIHGRTAAQMSTGLADWDEIGKAVKLRDQIAPNTILIGNGDVDSYAQVMDKHTQYNVDGVMIGRGIFGDPWVFEKSIVKKEHTREEYISIALSHLDLFDETWTNGEATKPYNIMKKFFKMYVKSFKGANELRIKLMATNNVSEARQLLKNV